MKRMTATEARRNWFRILDEVAAGAEVMVERGGKRIVIRREERGSEPVDVPDYSSILRIPDPEHADRWSWEWSDPEGDVAPVEKGE